MWGEFQPLQDSRVLSLLDSASQALCECDFPEDLLNEISCSGIEVGVQLLHFHELAGVAILVLGPHWCYGNKTPGPRRFSPTCYEKSKGRIME